MNSPPAHLWTCVCEWSVHSGTCPACPCSCPRSDWPGSSIPRSSSSSGSVCTLCWPLHCSRWSGRETKVLYIVQGGLEEKQNNYICNNFLFSVLCNWMSPDLAIYIFKQVKVKMTLDLVMSPWSMSNMKLLIVYLWLNQNYNNLTSNNCNNVTSNDLWPCHVTSKCSITWRFP